MRYALIASLLLSGVAQAQRAAAPIQDREAVTFEEVERGVYVGLSGGPLYIVNAPASAGRERPFSSGQSARIDLGIDIGTFLSAGVFVMASANRAGSNYLGESDGSASGDFSSLTAGGSVKASVFGLKDSQDVKRAWLYVRGGAGYLMFSPQRLLPRPDILVFAGPGLEYYTRLRHFSVGVEVVGAFLVTSATYGFAVMPNLRYAF